MINAKQLPMFEKTLGYWKTNWKCLRPSSMTFQKSNREKWEDYDISPKQVLRSIRDVVVRAVGLGCISGFRWWKWGNYHKRLGNGC